MAATERIPGNQPTIYRKRQVIEDDDSLDVELLCAKLEAWKREREDREAVSRLRKQVRSQVRTDSKDGDRPHLSNRASTNDRNKRASWYKLPNKFRQSLATLHANVPEPEPEQPFDLVSPVIDYGVLDHDEPDIVLLSGNSTPDLDAQWKRPPNWAKRSSFTVLKHFTSNDREQLRRIGNCNHDRPEETKRSQTVPFFRSKFLSSKQNLIPQSTQDCKDSCRPSDVDDSLGGFVNEYTISFDTCEVKETMRHQARPPSRPTAAPIQRPPSRPTAAPIQRPKLGSNEGMRSLLSLSSILKKDKKDRPQARVEEIQLPPNHDCYDYDDDPILRRPHTRSQTAPEPLIFNAATRLQKAEKAKKRRSVGGMLQNFLLPSHSMSMHQVAI